MYPIFTEDPKMTTELKGKRVAKTKNEQYGTEDRPTGSKSP